MGGRATEKFDIVMKARESTTTSEVETKVTIHDVWRALGVAMRYIGISNTPLCEFFFGMCWIRRTAQALASSENHTKWTDVAKFSPAEASSINKMLTETVSGGEFLVENFNPSPTNILFTDATPTSLGYTFISRTGVKVDTLNLDEPDAIHYHEAEAVLWAIKALSKRNELSNGLIVLVDNTIVLHSLKKGHSSCRRQNDLTREINQAIPRGTKIGYVQSQSNWADGPSRNMAPNMTDVRADLFEIKQRRTEVAPSSKESNS